MPHEKEKKRERGMQFRVALRMLILPVPDYQIIRTSASSYPDCYAKRNFVVARKI